MNLVFRMPPDRIAHEPHEDELALSVIAVMTVTFLIFKSLEEVVQPEQRLATWPPSTREQSGHV